MKKRLIFLLFFLFLFQSLVKSPARAESSPVSSEELSANSKAALYTVVPEGVTEIDLKVALGDGVYDVEDAWMLNADICVILRQPLEEIDSELIVLDTRNNKALSRTPVPHVPYQSEQGFDDGLFYLQYTSEDEDTYDDFRSYVKVTVAPDGTVMIGTVPNGFMVMPGGKTAIREVVDRSLYAVDLKTNKEELLIQGVAPMTQDSQGASYETFLKYVPCPDDEGYDTLTFPIDEETYYENDMLLWRDFYVYKPLDEYRFVYQVFGWEWGAGYGIYDLKTRTDHRITGRGYLCGMTGNTLYGSALMTDVNNLESSPLPKTVQEQLETANAMECDVDYDISLDGRLLALTGMKSERSDGSTVTITDIQTGNIIKSYDIYNPFALESSVTFYGDTRFMLFFLPREHGSAYIYLFNVEKYIL